MHDHSDVRVLQDLYEQLRTGELQKDHLLHKGRISNHKLRRLGVISSVHNIKSDPVRYQKYCQIKRYAERFADPIDADDVQRLYRDLIGKIKAAVGPIGSLVVELSSFDVYVKNNGFEQKLRRLQADGVILAQCANTLRELNINRHDLYSFIMIVPSGVGEITLRESQGWAYIHPAPPPQNSF